MEFIDIDLTSPGQCSLHFLRSPHRLPEGAHSFMIEKGLHVTNLVAQFMTAKAALPHLTEYELLDALMLRPKTGVFFLAPREGALTEPLLCYLGKVVGGNEDNPPALRLVALPHALTVGMARQLGARAQACKEPVGALLLETDSLLRRRLEETGMAVVLRRGPADEHI